MCCFAGHGKKSAWAMWAVSTELTNALLELSPAPHDILQEVMATIERFIILHYDRTSTSTDIDQARRNSFAKRHNVHSIPPTMGALKEHVKRAVYQEGQVWGQMLVSTPEFPSPCRWGWSKASEGHYEPFWTCLLDAGQSSYERISFKWKKGCVKQCKCPVRTQKPWASGVLTLSSSFSVSSRPVYNVSNAMGTHCVESIELTLASTWFKKNNPIILY